MNTVIKVENVTKKYKDLNALNNFSFEVKEGEIIGLLGPNGSGKTTAINSILGLLNFDEGNIFIFGEKMHPDAYHLKKDIGVVMQNVAVFEELTVFENINYFCGLYIKDRKECLKLVEEAIKLTGLENFKSFHPKKLSGGLLRRLNIACGIAHKPKLLFLDEPTVAVDPQSRNNILEGIKQLNKQGTTIVYTTHYMEEVELICDRVVIIDKGKVVAMGTIDELKRLTNIGEKVTVEFNNIKEENIEKIKKMSDVTNVLIKDNVITVYFNDNDQNIIKLLEYFKKENIETKRINSELPTLNDVFLEITGKELRD